MHTILVTGAGATIGYGLIRSARASSYSVRIVGMDIHKGAVGRHWCDHFERAILAAAPEYPEFLRDLILRHKIDLVLPGIEQDVARMSAEQAALGDLPARFVLPPPELLSVASDKWLSHQRLVAAGLPTIPTRIEGHFDELAEVLGVPFLLKPRRSSASKGIQRIGDGRDLEYWRTQVGDQFMVQQIVGDDDEEYSVGLFGYGDGTYSHLIALRRRLGREGSTVKAQVASPTGLEARVAELVALFRPHGPTNLQFRRHAGEFLLLEINPRLSSSSSLRTAFGINEVELCIEHYLLGRRPAPRLIRSGHAIRYLEDLITFDPDPSEVFVADLDPELGGVPLHLDLDPSATPRLRRSDEVDDHFQTPERTTTPVLGDPIEHLMLNLVPLARPRREVTHRDPQADLVGQPLQAQLPEPRPAPIAPPAVGRDQQLFRLGIDLLPHVPPPTPQRRHRELRRVRVDPDSDPAWIVGHVVEPVRDRLAQSLVFEVLTPRLLGTTLGLILTPPVLEIPDQLLLLRVHRDHRLAAREERVHAIVDVLELLIAIGVGPTLPGLAMGLEAVIQLLEPTRHGPGTDAMTLEIQLVGQVPRPLAGPAQGGFRVASGHGIDEFLQVADPVGIERSERLSPSTGLSNPASRRRAEGGFRRSLEFTNTASDCGQGQTGRLRYGRKPTPLQLQHFGGRPVPAEALVHTGPKGLVFPSKAFYDHSISHIESTTTRQKFVKSFLRRSYDAALSER